MHFVTNRISTGKAKTFADLVADYAAKKQGLTKQASAAEPVVKTARSDAKQEEGQSSGQLDVEPLHQKGESTPKVKHKDGDKDQKAGDKVVSSTQGQVKEADCGICDKDNENNGPAEESGQTKADFPKLTNDPEAGKHRDGDGDQDKKVGGAEAPAVTAGGKGSGGMQNFGDKAAAPFGKAAPEQKEGEGEEKPAKKASGRSWICLANLDSKSKNWLKKYWKDIYMTDYADAMTEDK